MKRRILTMVGMGAAASLLLAGCAGGGAGSDGSASGDVTIEFSQWWEVELKEGVMRDLMDRFEADNPGIKVELISNPYAATMEQEIAGAATGTLADVVSINGTTVYDLYEQGAITDLSALMEDADFDTDTLVSNDQIDGSTYLVRALNFTYPMYYNTDLLEAAGITEIPSTRSEFVAAAEAVTNPDTGTYAWSLPINVQSPAGFDPQSWLWASGGRFLDDGTPDFESEDVKDTLAFLQDQYQSGFITPGAFTQQEQDKVEEFTAGRNGMMIGSLAHINGIRESNPDLNFTLGAVPAEDGYTGTRGLAGATWGLGIAENSEHKAEAWKLIEWIMSTDVNAELATEAIGFPGNVDSVPGYLDGDELFQQAFDLYQDSELVTELDGLPLGTDLLRNLNENLVKLLDGDADVDTTAAALQEYWTDVLK
ncbi:ABC transporter substrate-binding protein [Amnibacterium flavum]|uniref:Sugar ABC transporter substrate-binding protein n=1 Tax=Amnibacterium flavum TaxID=2173173 RepID=A0A2V1HQB5_9MICO|nr:sugar ABC transporter substrate-binding protein [Amnibacterium flavum]PVZ94725.1 sugar ABC transporter substrate-binding protein [Amnibacterium flavum]